MKQKKPILQRLFVAFMMMQLVVYFLNSDMYFQVSGMFIFLFGAILTGLLWLFFYVWRRPVNAYQSICILLLVCTLVSVVANPGVVESGYLLSYLLLICMTFLFASLDLDERDLRKISGAYVALAVIISLLIIVVHKRFYAEESNRITIQIGSNPLIDPNYLGACLVAPSFLSLKWAMEEKKKLRYWLVTAIILVGIFMTGSRGALLAWGGGAFIVFCKLFFQHISFKKIGLLCLVGAASLAAVLRVIPAAYVERMLDPGNWLDGSNMRRFELWLNALEKILERPLLGHGLGNTATVIGAAAHNTYLELCVHLGLCGGLLFLLLMALAFFRKSHIYAKAILFSTAIWAVFISAEVTMYLWLNLSLCIAFSLPRQDGSAPLGVESPSPHNPESNLESDQTGGILLKRTVSIIVPVYNVEPYIFECVDSLLGQTYPDIEIILVDDASPDNCPRICDEYALQDPRVKVVHKPNGGLSDARNAGIDVATGDYILFVDSDDFIVPTMVEHLLHMAEKSGADIAACDYTGDPDKLSAETGGQFRVVNAEEALKCILVEKEFSTSASTKLYAAHLFSDVRFPVGKIYEDYATIYKVIHKSGKVAYNREKKYYYRPNPTGITGGKFYKKQMQYFEISEQVMAFVRAEYPKLEKHVTNRAERMAIAFYRMISESGFDDRETIRILTRFIRKHIWRYLFSGYAPLSKMYGLMVSIMPGAALKVFSGKRG